MLRTIAGSAFLLIGFAALAQTNDMASCPMHAQHTAAALPQGGHEHHASMSPYTSRTTLPIKALTPETIDAYRNGTGNGMALPAELNGYPGPRHVLDLADKLQLTDAQKASMKRIFDDMHAAAVPLGEEIIEREKALDALFSGGKASDREVARLTGEIAGLQGRLRSTHLNAHVATKAILSPEQIKAYGIERGYASASQR